MAVVLKIAADGDVHRVRLDAPPTYDALDALLRSLWPNAGASGGCSWARYTDEEGDMCRLTRATFADFLETARTTSGGVCPVLRLEVVVPPSAPDRAAADGAARRAHASEGGSPAQAPPAASRSPSPAGSSGSWVCVEAARERGSTSSDGSWVTCAQTPNEGSSVAAEPLSRAESNERSSGESGELEAGFEPTALNLAELHADDWGSSAGSACEAASTPAAETPPLLVSPGAGGGGGLPLLSHAVAEVVGEVEGRAVEGTVADEGAASVISVSSAGGRRAAGEEAAEEEEEEDEQQEEEEAAARDAAAADSEQEVEALETGASQAGPGSDDESSAGAESEEAEGGEEDAASAALVAESKEDLAAADDEEAPVPTPPASVTDVLLQLAAAAACPVDAPAAAPTGSKRPGQQQGLLLDALDLEAGLAELGAEIPPPPPAPSGARKPRGVRAPGAAKWEGSGMSKAPPHLSSCQVVHMGHICDGCEACPLPGPRFTCKACGDFDLCWTCYMRRHELPRPHDRAHHFQQVLWSEEVVPACPGGCGFGVTKCSSHPTHCCSLCAQVPGQHTAACFTANAHDEELEP